MRIYVHILGDLATAALLVVFGAIGFAHDDNNYLSNGIWRQDDDANWLGTEAAAGLLLLASL